MTFALSSLFISFFLIWSVGAPCYAADKLSESKKRLQQVQEQIGSTSKQIKQKKATERSALQRLEELERNISASDRQLNASTAALRELKEKIATTQKNSGHYEDILKRARKDVEKRLRVLYTTGDAGTLRLIFSDASPAVIAENTEFLQRITSHDKALMLQYRTQVENLKANQKALEEQKERYAETMKQQKERRRELEQAKREQAALVSKIRQDSSMLKKLLADLQERSEAMQELVTSLERKKSRSFVPSEASFESVKGELGWPSSGSVRSDFGVHKHKQFGSQVKTNGLEIAAVPGTHIKAIWEGKVVFAAPFKGYGNMLILDHGDKYYSLYANAAKLQRSKGDSVKAGDVIATAGYAGGDSYYFEIRHRGTPLNPNKWLKPRTY
ncbi:MAG: murein hydrolase activator EnvC family protein [Thermodesulfobacteriota bacterium]